MRFNRLQTNGLTDPIGTGRDIALTWNYTGDGERDAVQQSYRVFVSWDGGSYDTGIRCGDAMRFALTEELELHPATAYTWQVTATVGGQTMTSPMAHFETAADDLDRAAWITCGEKDQQISAPVFEKTFSVGKKIRTARAYVTGLGWFVCSVNNRLCCDHFFMPANTRYDIYQYYETLDITPYILSGENTISLQLGCGYDMAYSKWGFRYDGKKGLRCSIVLTYEDGATERIDSDDSWCFRDSAVTENGMYLGETCDARRTEFSRYPAVPSESDAPKGKLLPDEMPPIRVRERFSPIAFWENGNSTVYDFGVNLQGITEITVKAAAGTKIIIRHSEMLFPDGTPDPETNREARATDTYICSGVGVETWHPSFTYHGFRYAAVEVIGEAAELSIRALMLCADVEDSGDFSCSDATVMRIHELCRQSMHCNQVSIPTDCPVRDERTPCNMDSQMMEAAAIHNFNMESYYRKWYRDITASGHDIASANPDWYGDYIMLAYRLYHFYGDLRLMKAGYADMMEEVRFWVSADGGVHENGYGDWCLPNDNTWEGFGQCKASVNTALLYAYCCILEEVSAVLGNEENRALCAEWKETVRAGFIDRHYHGDGSIASGRQPDIVLPAFFGLLQGEKLEKSLAVLRKMLEETGHLDTGGYGTMALLPVMAAAGAVDLIPQILSVDSYPGFGYLLANGATSLWEQWAYKGAMHSHSHEMHAGIDASFYRLFCGVTVTEAGYRSFRV
ncbi:MAG: family 78 glycoside hydrolase catalytic domain, partial [Clostridia bacterium]|nr:family 78 glycoside hydrolase catalytic domain [Clostridia bacterium]